MDRARLAVALSHANVGAFLRVIREGESSQKPTAYQMRWGGLKKPVAYFDDFSRHPRIFEPTTGGRQSSAAGAYQIVATTYDSIAPSLGITDFSPASQDALAVALIDRRAALDDVMAGRIERAIVKLRPEWTSLPGAAESNGWYTMDRALEVYAKYGGRLAVAAPDTQPAAPIEDRSTPYVPPDTGRIFNPEQEAPMVPALIPLGIGLIQSLIQAFAPLAREKIAKEIGRHTNDTVTSQQLADNLLGVVQQVTGKPDPVDAVAAAKADPALAEKVQAATLDALSQLAPLLDKLAAHDLAVWQAEESGRDAAGERGRADGDKDIGPLLVQSVVGIVVGVLVMLGAIMGIQTWFNDQHEPSTSMLTLVGPLIGAIFGALGTMVAYRFGTTRNNSIKDITVEQLSRRGAR